MPKTSYQKRALLLILLLLLLSIGSLLWILFRSMETVSLSDADSLGQTNPKLVADIYQNGTLLQSIPLSSVTESYTFTIIGENGACNEIEVFPGSIGIISANCPDKLCVKQGHISNSLLPITCLPNHLVIQLHSDTHTDSLPQNTVPNYTIEEIIPDIITY